MKRNNRPGPLQCDLAEQSGLSLVEVMIAIMIFSLGAMAVLTMTTGSFRANGFSAAIDGATSLGRTKMDALISLDYDHADLTDVTVDGLTGLGDNHPASNPLSDPLRADFSEINGRYQVFWNVAANTPVNGAKRIAVIISWQSNQVTKQLVFQTIKAE